MIGTLEKVMEDMRNGVTDYTKDGECSGCGQCCSNYLPLSIKECFRIREYVRRKHIAECVNRPPTADPVQDWTCPFRDSVRGICTIYEIRPAICRDFRCDKTRKDIQASKELFHQVREIVDMRATFFPKEG